MTPSKQFALIVALTMMWGPSFLFIKLAVEDLPPLTIVSLRVTIAAVIFCCILLWNRRSLPTNLRFWACSATMALFSSSLPFFLFCYAEQSIDSALAAILNGTTPMFTALLAHAFVSSDRMNSSKAVGITLCAVGVIILFAPKIMGGISGTTTGMLAGLAAAISYAISHIYGKLFTGGQKPFIAPAAQFIASSVMLWPIAIWHDQIGSLAFPSLSAIGGIIGLALCGTVFAFIIYYKLLEHCGPTAISMAACLFPIVGIVLGYLFLDEALSYSGVCAAILVLGGMMVANQILPLSVFNAKTWPFVRNFYRQSSP